MTGPKTHKTALKKPPACQTHQTLSPPLAIPEEEEESSESDVGNAPPHLADEYYDDEEEVVPEESGETDRDEEGEEVLDTVELVEVPQKCKGQSKANKKSFPFNLTYFFDSYCLFLIEKSAKATDKNKAEELQMISYTIMAFTAEELKKPAAQHVSKSNLVDLAPTMDWLDAMAHFKIAICDLLFPQQAVIADEAFEVTWSIPRVAPGPFMLKMEVQYKQLISKASSTKNPTVQILINEVQIVV